MSKCRSRSFDSALWRVKEKRERERLRDRQTDETGQKKRKRQIF